jgi:hypothetical protein
MSIFEQSLGHGAAEPRPNPGQLTGADSFISGSRITIAESQCQTSAPT